MLKKLGLVAIGFLVGFIVGGLGVMAYSGYTLAQGMFMLQDMDLSRAEDTATQAYFNESAETGIWALENYLDYFETVIGQRTESVDEPKSVFLLVDPHLRWISYVRLGLLYEKKGDMAMRDKTFEKAVTLLGLKAEDTNINEMINAVKKHDEEDTAKQDEVLIN